MTTPMEFQIIAQVYMPSHCCKMLPIDSTLGLVLRLAYSRPKFKVSQVMFDSGYLITLFRSITMTVIIGLYSQ